ncbi:MAG: hypothetical protein HQL89_18550 [Magnetococcales bacterium]|nr:hypothetical protein [Magnetococcales bacterium]
MQNSGWLTQNGFWMNFRLLLLGAVATLFLFPGSAMSGSWGKKLMDHIEGAPVEDDFIYINAELSPEVISQFDSLTVFFSRNPDSINREYVAARQVFYQFAARIGDRHGSKMVSTPAEIVSASLVLNRFGCQHDDIQGPTLFFIQVEARKCFPFPVSPQAEPLLNVLRDIDNIIANPSQNPDWVRLRRMAQKIVQEGLADWDDRKFGTAKKALNEFVDAIFRELERLF